MGAKVDLECSGCEKTLAEDSVVYCEGCTAAEVGPLYELVSAIDSDVYAQLENEVPISKVAERAVATLQKERAIAKELLEALEWVLAPADDCDCCRRAGGTCIGHEAIAKATGGAR